MKLNLIYLTTILTLASFAITTISCRKHLRDCAGNCALLTFEGTVFNKSTNRPVPNQPVKVQMSYSGFCLLCTTLDVASTKTDTNGHFKIVTEFDTNYFKQNYYLSIQSILPNSYVQYPIAVGSDLSYTNANNYRMYNTGDSSFKNLLFIYYSKTTLNLNLHRTSAVIAGDSSLELNYKMGNGESASGFQQSQANRDTTITIYTGANVYTKITTTRYKSAIGYISKSDSIVCSPNGSNSIDIYY